MTKHKQQIGITDKTEKSEETNSGLYALILFFFFISGLTGLIYEILWTRLIIKIIGSAPFAVSIVLTVFMGGLGLGSYLASRTIDRIKNPMNLVKLYGILEIVIGLYGLVFPVFFILFKPLFIILYNRLFGYFLIYNFFTFIGCSLLLLFPVTCMGATLPVLSRFYVTKISHVGSRLGRLYGLNTIGAAAGSLLCGFWIINVWGVQGSLIFAVTLNIIIGTSCIIIGSKFKVQNSKIISKPYKTDSERFVEEAETTLQGTVPDNVRIMGLGALIIFSVSGFCAMAYEVIWIKLLGLLVGPTTYSFTIVLITFISGLALGSVFFGWLADKIKKTLQKDTLLYLLIFTQIFAALFALFISQIMGNSQIFFAKLIYQFQNNFAYLTFLKSFILFIFMLFPTFFLGATFPIVGKIYTFSLSHIGKSVGFAYSINTIGAVLGSFCAGFVLIPLMGKENSLRLIIAIQLITSSATAGFIFWKTRENIAKLIPLFIPIIFGLMFSISYPHWNRKMLSIGKYHRFEEPRLMNIGWFEALLYGTDEYANYYEGDIVYFGDGIGGFTAVHKYTDIFGDISYSLFNSGKPDASSIGDDMITQTLLAHFPMLFHHNPKKVMVLGLASGITAGEILHYPIEKLDVVDINDQVVSASNYFIPWNNNVLSNPKTELIIQDGRAHLELTKRKYDVIISEPSNPWMAGLAALFTQDFFNLAGKKLNDDGIFCQWIHSYQMDWPTFALIGRTFAQVFPNSLLVNLDLLNIDPLSIGADYLLIGFKGEKGLDIDIAEQNLIYAQQSKNMTLLNHKLLYRLIVNEDLIELFAEGPINTDNLPKLEFTAPKLMHFDDPAITEHILSKKRIKEKTEKIIQEISTDVDEQIDFAAFAFSFDKTFNNMVDLSKATPAQRERFSKIVQTYCLSNIIEDFSFINDERLEKECVSVRINAVREKIKTIPEKAPLYNHLGNIFYTNEMHDEALTNYLHAVEADSEFYESHQMAGIILSSQGKLEEAVTYFNNAISINPDFATAHTNLGKILYKQNKVKEATSHYEKAIKSNPDYAIAYISLGNLKYRQENHEEALALYKKAISINNNGLKIDPNHVIAYNNIGNILYKQNKLEEAITYYEKAIGINSSYVFAYINLANILANQNKLKEAIGHYEKVLRIEPEFSQAHKNLGIVLKKTGKTKEGEEHIQEALRLDRENAKFNTQ